MRTFVAISLFSLMLLWTIAQRVTPMTTDTPAFKAGGDHDCYLAMAEGRDYQPPPGYPMPCKRRILTPWIASRLPFDIQTNFQIVTFGGLWATMIALYYLLRSYHIMPPIAAFGLLLFAGMGAAVAWCLYDFWLCDPLLFLAVTLCAWCIRTKRDVWFAVVLAIGVLNKEAVLAIATLWFTTHARNEWKRGILLVIPAGLIWLILQGIYAGNYSLVGEFGRLIGRRQIDPIAWSFGAFWIAPIFSLFAPRVAWKTIRPWIPFVALVYAQLLIATDTERLLVLAFPVVIIAGMTAVQYRVQRPLLHVFYSLSLDLYRY